MIPVWWWKKVRFFEVMVVLGITPLELTQCLRPPPEMVRSGAKQLFIVEVIPMEV